MVNMGGQRSRGKVVWEGKEGFLVAEFGKGGVEVGISTTGTGIYNAGSDMVRQGVSWNRFVQSGTVSPRTNTAKQNAGELKHNHGVESDTMDG